MVYPLPALSPAQQEIGRRQFEHIVHRMRNQVGQVAGDGTAGHHNQNREENARLITEPRGHLRGGAHGCR